MRPHNSGDRPQSVCEGVCDVAASASASVKSEHCADHDADAQEEHDATDLRDGGHRGEIALPHAPDEHLGVPEKTRENDDQRELCVKGTAAPREHRAEAAQ